MGGGEGDNVTSPLMLQRVKLNVKVGLQLSRLYLFFFFQSPVTCLIWPPEQQNIVFGLADGKVS